MPEFSQTTPLRTSHLWVSFPAHSSSPYLHHLTWRIISQLLTVHLGSSSTFSTPVSKGVIQGGPSITWLQSTFPTCPPAPGPHLPCTHSPTQSLCSRQQVCYWNPRVPVHLHSPACVGSPSPSPSLYPLNQLTLGDPSTKKASSAHTKLPPLNSRCSYEAA